MNRVMDVGAQFIAPCDEVQAGAMNCAPTSFFLLPLYFVTLHYCASSRFIGLRGFHAIPPILFIPIIGLDLLFSSSNS